MKTFLYTTALVFVIFCGIVLLSNPLVADSEKGDSVSDPDSLQPETKTITKKIAELNYERCIKCGLCASVCPEGAITMVDHKPIIDPKKCTATETCVKRCPTRALSMVDYEMEVPAEEEEKADSTKTEDNNKKEDQ
ncbi:MAG: ATP-binding protein [Candidatus Zixiibacteriota bacterium]